MKVLIRKFLLAACWFGFVACADYEAEPVERVAGALSVGVADDFLSLPVGSPLGGYTARWDAWGNEGEVDKRASDYRYDFNPSAGVQTRIPVKAFWFDNGQEHLVILKVDLIYSFDGLVTELEQRLGDATGEELRGRVVVATNHSHSAYGNFSDQEAFFLGGDRFNVENFFRLASTVEAVALEAYTGRAPANVGVGFDRDWDPDDLVYRDRRDDNDETQFFDDIPAGPYKDPLLWMMRIDDLKGAPRGVLYGFGMHGTVLGGENAMISVDAPGYTEIVLQERFDEPVVVAHLQAGAGDTSPAGSQSDFARLESVGEYAADGLFALWETIPTSSEPVEMETQTQALFQSTEAVQASRNGTVDWFYLPYEEGYEPDGIVYNDDGSIASPVDEFNTWSGTAFCGGGDPYIPGLGLGTEVFPYASCTHVSSIVTVIESLFGLDYTPGDTDGDRLIDSPIPHTQRALMTSSMIGPLTMRLDDGTSVTDDFLLGFFPGEPVATFVEMWRRRVADELGFEHAALVGYAQDHEGYLMIAEDWLTGGYEPFISFWGPLLGDHMLDSFIRMSQGLLTDTLDEDDPFGVFGPTDYEEWSIESHTVDHTPEAGTLLSESPEYLYSPLLSEDELDDGVLPNLDFPSVVERVGGLVQFAWKGGDPAVDLPRVELEILEGDTWTVFLTQAGRAVSDDYGDILLAHTPDPLYPAEADQTHYWWAAWQTVGHVSARSGLPEGTYRLHVYGQRATGGESWPFEVEPYEFTTDEFEVIAAELTLEASGTDLSVSIAAHERGFRFVHQAGETQGANPLEGHEATLLWAYAGNEFSEESLVGSASGSVTLFESAIPSDAISVTVTDAYGNVGSLDLSD